MPDSFHDVLFPIAVSFGATGGPQRRNEIVRLMSGREKRNARTAHAMRHYDAGTGLRSADDLYDVMVFFEARRGSLHGFRFRDPFDMRSGRPGVQPGASDQQIGAGNGLANSFQLIKAYGAGEDAYLRPVTKPVVESVIVAVGGEVVAGGGFTVDGSTGLVTLESTPAEGVIVTAGFEFHVPVRFDTDRIEASMATFKAGAIPTIPLVEILS